MQIILYSKQDRGNPAPEILRSSHDLISRLTEKGKNTGILAVCSNTGFKEIGNPIREAGFLDCGVKDKRMQLQRALKFTRKSDRSRPRFAIFDPTSTGSYKRSLIHFFSKHYNAADPCCIVIIPDSLFNMLLLEEESRRRKGSKAPGSHPSNPSETMFNIDPEEPVIKKLRNVYIGGSAEISHIRALIFRASQTDNPVLILGESGTGKDVIATQIFENSLRYNRKFFRVNCSAIPDTLLESELFGHRKGSFSDARTDKKGILLEAEGGMVFLDEIGDLSLSNQAKLLHAVENKEIRPLGQNTGIPSDFRIITATNRNLHAMMQNGTFREDLYFRISMFLINAPPLREHPEDIPAIVRSYWNRKQLKGQLSTEFLEYLKKYHWPGNVRELYGILNSISDYFGPVSPEPDHIETIRKMRRETLHRSSQLSSDDDERLLKIKSSHMLGELETHIRSVKMALRPILNHHEQTDPPVKDLTQIMEYVEHQMDQIDRSLTNPILFRSYELFDAASRFRYLLSRMITIKPYKTGTLKEFWLKEPREIYEKIIRLFIDVMWQRIDM